MAQAMLAITRLKMVYDAGMDDNGKPLYKTKTFNNVKKDATADQLLQTARALAALSNEPLSTVERIDSSEIIG
ncbi:DUF1659 domain-containing protein [Neobacillus terrae]|uniref:DUF1659 domain-containing protein n=1 Tax=Neobacillus terrae TaxID=3034837 RepID=UPI0014073F26|nr:DUF1659 domain-containing protein [Neobacillus terrae]NHM32311.1 DUF1659 domain-containing protein [Neobacillus terrae]